MKVRVGPDARHAAQQVFPLVPQETVPQAVGQVLVQVIQLFVRGRPGPGRYAAERRATPFPALLLSNLHLDNLPAAGDQRFQFSSIGRSKRLCHGATGLTEVCDRRRVEAVRLGQLPQGSGEVADLSGVHDSHGDICGAQDNHEGGLVSTGGLQNDQSRMQVAELLDEPGDACFILGSPPRSPCGAHRNIEPLLRDIDSNEHVWHLFLHGPSSHDAGSGWPRQLFGLSKSRGGPTRLSWGLPTKGSTVCPASIKIQGQAFEASP